MRPTTVYELHIFKDVDNTSWVNPRVHTFPLSDNAALPVIRNNESNGGLSSLRLCSPEQLSFLQSHLAAKNAALKSAREAEIKEQKAREARRKQEAQKEREREYEELKKRQLEMNEKASKLKEQNEDEKNDNEDKILEEGNGENDNSHPPHGFNSIPHPPPPPFSPYIGPENFPNQVHYGRNRSSAGYIYPSFPGNYPPPPPPPPPPALRSRDMRSLPSPLELESDWNLESVDLDLIPVVARLKVKKLKASSVGPKNRHIGHCDLGYPRRGSTRLPRIAYQLADSAKVEIAVIYSRTAMTNAVKVPGGKVREEVYYGHRSEMDGSVYEYDSDIDIEEILAGKEEGDDEEEEGEEEGNNAEEDLEIVEGFNHCHPLTESMSKCCLEKEC